MRDSYVYLGWGVATLPTGPADPDSDQDTWWLDALKVQSKLPVFLGFDGQHEWAMFLILTNNPKVSVDYNVPMLDHLAMCDGELWKLLEDPSLPTERAESCWRMFRFAAEEHYGIPLGIGRPVIVIT